MPEKERADRMNDIREQINTLSELAEIQDAPYKKWIINRAAGTIESLYSELQSVNASHKQAGWDYKQQMMERFTKVN